MQRLCDEIWISGRRSRSSCRGGAQEGEKPARRKSSAAVVGSGIGVKLGVEGSMSQSLTLRWVQPHWVAIDVLLAGMVAVEGGEFGDGWAHRLGDRRRGRTR